MKCGTYQSVSEARVQENRLSPHVVQLLGRSLDGQLVFEMLSRQPIERADRPRSRQTAQFILELLRPPFQL